MYIETSYTSYFIIKNQITTKIFIFLFQMNSYSWNNICFRLAFYLKLYFCTKLISPWLIMLMPLTFLFAYWIVHFGSQHSFLLLLNFLSTSPTIVTRAGCPKIILLPGHSDNQADFHFNELNNFLVDQTNVEGCPWEFLKCPVPTSTNKIFCLCWLLKLGK